MTLRSRAIVSALAGALGCGASTADPAAGRPTPVGSAEPAATAEPEPEPEPQQPDEAEPAWPLPEHVLSPFETALIVIDPHHLTRTLRLQRAYARRKAIMLDPDSPTARVLDDLAKAAAAGEIDPHAEPGSSMVFTAPGVAPAGRGKPAGVRDDDDR